MSRSAVSAERQPLDINNGVARRTPVKGADRRPPRIRVLMVPPICWEPYRRDFVQGAGPDPFALQQQLAEHGIDLTIFDPYPFPFNPLAGRHNLIQSLDPLRALGILFGKRAFDVIVSVFEGAAAPLVLLRRLLAFNVPIVLWDIGLTEGWALRKRIQDIVIPRVEGILVLGSNQASYVKRRWAPRGRVETIGHQIDTEFFQPQAAAVDEYVLAVGDDPFRDYGTLLAAADGLATEVVLRTGASLPELPRNVRVISQRLDFRQLRDLYAKCRYVVVPLADALHAGGVTALLEAGAMAKPLIVSDSSGIRDFIVPGTTCLQVPPHDVGKLREALQTLIGNPELAARLGRNARDFTTDNCSIPVFAARFAAELRSFAHADTCGSG